MSKNEKLVTIDDHKGIHHAASGSSISTMFVWVLVLLGLLARLSPLSDIKGRLFWQYMTEDGYLMQTVARNMAIGLGMSTADGTIPTNGVQPLATYLFAGLHALAQGDKALAIILVTLFSTLIAAGSAWLLARVGQHVFRHLPHGRLLANLAAALWFTAPLITRHSMNGLETGLYQAILLLTMLFYLQHFCATSVPSWNKRILLGFALGLAFLARNDAVFFIAAMLFAHVFLPVPSRSYSIVSRFTTAMVAGFLSIMVASPWLINNYLGFGSIIPISGTAQSHAAGIGRNLPWVAAHIFENAWLWLPVPSKLETLLPAQLVAISASVAALATYWVLVGRLTIAAKTHFVVGVLFTTSLVAYYGLFFGAHWFLPRYFSSASPFLWLFVVGAVYMGARTTLVLGRIRLTASYVGMCCLTCMAALFAANDYRKGSTHMHKQVVDWTRTHVRAEDWVGAPQTGTLGYFHDRTINLDGKVNPEALRSLLDDGHSLNYVLASPVQYIIDWVGIVKWVSFVHLNARFGQEFEVVVEDPVQNLAVLRRRPSPQ